MVLFYPSKVRVLSKRLRGTSGFDVVAVLVVALGICLVTVVFSLADSLLFRAAPGIREPERLMSMDATARDGSVFNSFSEPAYDRLRQTSGLAQSVAAFSPVELNLSDAAGARRIWGMAVSPSFFGVLGTRPLAGRFFDGRDDDPRVVVISHGFWVRNLAASRAAMGGKLIVNGQPFTIIGVAPKGFTGTVRGFAADLWLTLDGERLLYPVPGSAGDSRNWLQILVRLPERGGSYKMVAGATQAISMTTVGEGAAPAVQRVSFRQADRLYGRTRTGVLAALTVLFVAGACFLLAALANAAALFLSHAVARSGETAIRVALGATRYRLLREYAGRGLGLGLACALTGLGFASFSIRALNQYHPLGDVPIDLGAHLNGRSALFALVIGAAVAGVFVLVPAREAWRTDVMGVMRASEQTAGHHATRLRSWLVTVQTAVTLLLLAGGGVFAGALRKGLSLPPGFDAANVVVGSVNLDTRGYAPAAGAAFQRELLARVRTLPSVAAASLTTSLPLGSTTSATTVSVGAGETSPSVPVEFASVGEEFFRALRIPVLQGRDFGPEDVSGAPKVAVVNDVLARRLWGTRAAVGRSVRMGGAAYEVVGVSGSTRQRSLAEEPGALLYLPLAQGYSPVVTLVVRTRGDPSPLLAVLPRVVRTLDPSLPLVDIGTMNARVAASLLPQRILATVATSLGAVGFALATLGFYGLFSLIVSNRRREIGIRVALGETRRSVRTRIVRQSVIVTIKGLAGGLVLVVGMMAALHRMVFGVGMSDAAAVLVAAGLLVGAAAIASYLPVRRASNADASLALRATL